MTQKRAVALIAVSSLPQMETDSIPMQRARLTELAAQQGYVIIDWIEFDGFSRSYLTWRELMEAAAEDKDSTANPADMWQHWKARDFEVALVRDGTRFARKASLFAEFISRTVDMGATIHMVNGGIIDESNALTHIAIGGFQAQREVMELMRRKEEGLTRNMREGKPIGRTPHSHVTVRNERGKPARYELNPDAALLWRDLATLILEGVAWRYIEKELNERFGHVNPSTGRAWKEGAMHRYVHTPLFWGHIARHFNHKPARSSTSTRLSGSWTWDETMAPPDGVAIERSVAPAVWTDDLAERIKAELRRRNAIATGHGSSHHTHKFAGLCVCAQCGYQCVTYVQARAGKKFMGSRKVRCSTRFTTSTRTACTNKQMVTYTKVEAFLKEQIAEAQANGGILAASHATVDVSMVEALTQDVARLKAQIDTLVRRQSTAPDNVQDVYATQISEAAEEKKTKETRLAQSQAQHQRIIEQTQQQHAALKAIVDYGEGFWTLPEARINQYLHRLLGDLRIAVDKGEIVALQPRNFLR